MNIFAHLIFLLWCLIQTYLSHSIAANDVDPNNLLYNETKEIPIPFAIEHLYTLKINNEQQLLIVGEDNICWLNSANYPNCTQSFLNSGFPSLNAVREVPDGAFSFPAIIIAETGITVLDISDVQDIKLHHIHITLDQAFVPLWINNKEFLVYVFTFGSGQRLSHFKNVGNTGKGEWKETKVLELETDTKTLLKIVWNSYDVVYTATKNALYVLWTEDEKGNPGDWQKNEHIKKDSIDVTDTGNVHNLELVDFNKGGNITLLVIGTVVRAFDIPRSADFKNLRTYKTDLFLNFGKWSDLVCEHAKFFLKPFVPYISYNGKPWMFATSCEITIYLKPDELTGDSKVGKLTYNRNELNQNTPGVFKHFETMDVDQDGYTDIFIGFRKILYVYQFKDAPPITRTTATAAVTTAAAATASATAAATAAAAAAAVTATTPTTSSSIIKLSLNCMVFILACFTGNVSNG